METRKRNIFLYRKPDGTVPVEIWLGRLRDVRTRARIQVRIGKLYDGNLGDHGAVGDGVVELREHFGPGYRIYLGLDGRTLIVLLCGGDKSTQRRDVGHARAWWRLYKASKQSGGGT